MKNNTVNVFELPYEERLKLARAAGLSYSEWLDGEFKKARGTDEPVQYCACCHRVEVCYSQRYPDYLCPSCIEQLVDKNDRPVAFFNIDGSGGCKGRYKDGDKEEYPSNVAYVRGKKFYAYGAYMGGIIVMPYDWETYKERALNLK